MPLGLRRLRVRLAASPRGAGLDAPAPPSLFEQVLELSQGRPVFTADHYVPQEVEGGTNVRRFTDWNNSANYLQQTSFANQVAAPAPSALFNGALVCTFDRSKPNFYTANSSNLVNFMHDGTGGTMVCVGRLLDGANIGTIVGTRDQTGRGFSLVGFPSTTMHFYVLTSTDQFVLQIQHNGVPPVPAYADLTFDAAAPVVGTMRIKGTVVAQQASTGAVPQAGPSSQPLRLGTDTGNHTSMLWHSLLFFPPLTSEGRSTVQQWIQSVTGIAP